MENQIDFDVSRALMAHISPTPWRYNSDCLYLEDAAGEQIVTKYDHDAICIIVNSHNAMLAEIERLNAALEAKETVNRLYQTTVDMVDQRFTDAQKEANRLKCDIVTLHKAIEIAGEENAQLQRLAGDAEKYIIHSKAISACPSCNDCAREKTCDIKPRLGEICRINCHLWQGPNEREGK